MPAELPEPRDREMLVHVTAFGKQLLRETTDPAVIAAFRLAIAEALHLHTPEVARELNASGITDIAGPSAARVRRLDCRDECLLVRVKLARGSTKANGRV